MTGSYLWTYLKSPHQQLGLSYFFVMYKPMFKLLHWHWLDDMSAPRSSFFSSSPYYRLSCSSVFQPLMSAQTGFSIGARLSSGLDYWSLIQLRTQVKWRKDRLGTWQLKIIIFYSSLIERGLSKSIRGMVGLEQKCYLCTVMDKQNGKETKENWFWFGHFHNLSFYHFHADFFSSIKYSCGRFRFFWPDLWPQCRKKCQTPLSRLSGQSCVLLPGFGVQSQITMANWRLFFIGNGIGLELKRGIF